MRESTQELPTPHPAQAPAAVEPHPRLPQQALHAEPMTTQLPGDPLCPHHRLPTGTEGRTLDLAEEELVQGEMEGVFEFSGFSNLCLVHLRERRNNFGLICYAGLSKSVTEGFFYAGLCIRHLDSTQR